MTGSQPGQAGGRPGAQASRSQSPHSAPGSRVPGSSPIHHLTPSEGLTFPSESQARDRMGSALGIPAPLSLSWPGCSPAQVSELPHQQGEPRPVPSPGSGGRPQRPQRTVGSGWGERAEPSWLPIGGMAAGVGEGGSVCVYLTVLACVYL